MRILTAILLTIFSVVSVSSASAQQRIYSLHQDTVFKSVQCEIGLFGVKAKKAGLPADMRAHIKYATNGTVHGNVSANAGFADFFDKILQGPKVTASLDFNQVDKNTIEGKMNVHKGNVGACVGARKNAPAVPLKIYECLSKSLDTLAGGFGTSCNKSVTVKAVFNASGKFVFWVVTIGPEAAADYTVTYTIDIDAPAADDKKG